MYSKWIHVRRYIAFVLLSCSAAASWADNATFGPDAAKQPKESSAAAQRFSKAAAPHWVTYIGIPASKSSTEPTTLRLADTQLRWDANGETVYVHQAIQANADSGIPKLGQLAL